LNAPLAVTWSRIVAIPVLMVLLLADEGQIPGGRWLAFGVFVGAVLTDWVDGRMARALGQVTMLGSFLDSLADKLLVSAALVALIELGQMSAWAALIIISREFAVTGLRLVAAAEDLLIPSSNLGRWKMASQSLALAWIIAPGGPKMVEDILSGVYYFLMARRRLFDGGPPRPKELGRL
jgi:CDP-diacylglycerol--glycerol-3-phosphate 3-phosphatidyltransferase